MQKKIENIFSILKKVAFELVAWNIHFYRERILVIGTQYIKNSLKISDTTNTKFFELKFFQSDQKRWENYCRADFSSVLDRLTCWLSMGFRHGTF